MTAKNLYDQIFAIWHNAGQPGSLDSWASKELKGLRTKALPIAGLVERGAVTSRQWVEITAVMNQGFNGQVASIRVVATGALRQIPLKELRALEL